MDPSVDFDWIVGFRVEIKIWRRKGEREREGMGRRGGRGGDENRSRECWRKKQDHQLLVSAMEAERERSSVLH